MQKEDIKKMIEEVLRGMGCTDIIFANTEEDLIVSTFNCKEITSFVANIKGWTYSGIHLDPTHVREYKIDFKKLT